MVGKQTHYGQWLAVLVSCFIAASCGHHKEKDASDDSDSGSVSSNGGGASGGSTAAPSQMNVTGSLNLDLGLTDTPSNVTDIMAVNMTGQGQRLFPLSGDTKTFSLDLDKSKPWLLMLLDRSKVGPDMIVGRLKIKDLNTIPAMAGAQDALDLGTVSTDANGEASSSTSYEDLLVKLGLTEEGADFFSSIDGSCLRYVNPDVNGNGIIDVLEPVAPNFGLDFHVRFDAKVPAGATATKARVNDIVNQFLPADSIISYDTLSSIMMVNSAYFGAQPAEYSGVFTEKATVSDFTANGTTVVTYAPGTPVIIPFTNADGGSTGYGFPISFQNPNVAPSGTYKYGINDETFTFTHVEVRDFAKLQTSLVPFVQIDADADGHLQGITWEWRALGKDGKWKLATAEQIELVSGPNGAYASLNLQDAQGERLAANVAFRISLKPTGHVTLAETELVNLSPGMSAADAAATTMDQLWMPGISYDDKLGMRIFVNIAPYQK